MDQPKKAVLDLASLDEVDKAALMAENRRLCSCVICPTYGHIKKKSDELAYCIGGRSRYAVNKAKICYCVKCPVHFKLRHSKIFFCDRGGEVEQRTSKKHA